MTDQGPGSRVAGRGYKQLLAWQKSHALALEAFRISESLRSRHRWLADQLSRSAVSVAANIAEGYNRGSLREYIQFLNIARGSLGETEYFVLFAGDAGLLPTDAASELDTLVDDAGRLLLGLIRSLQAKDGRRPERIVREDVAAYGPERETNGSPATHDPGPTTLPKAQ